MLKLSLYLLLLGMVFWSRLSYSTEEKDCGEIRLDQGKGPFADMPVYDQLAFADKADSNICFAVAASQLIDANRFYQEEKLPKQLSAPVSIALTTKWKSLAWNETDVLPRGAPQEAVISSGVLLKALKYAANFKVCDQNWLNDFEGSFGVAAAHPFPTAVDAEIYKLYPSKRNFLRAATAEINKYRDIPLGPLAGIFGGKGEPKITEGYFECRMEENQLPLKDLQKAIKAAAEYATPLGQMNEFMQHFCAGHSFQPKIPAPQFLERAELMEKGESDYEPYRTETMEKKVHELLTAEPHAKPVAVTFCGSAMRKKGEGELRDDRLGFLHSSNCTVHSALVVGRKFNPNTKSCEFLVRDSYGPGCVNTEGKPLYDWDCENGSVWMDSKQLMKSTFHLIWL